MAGSRRARRTVLAPPPPRPDRPASADRLGRQLATDGGRLLAGTVTAVEVGDGTDVGGQAERGDVSEPSGLEHRLTERLMVDRHARRRGRERTGGQRGDLS